jgi:hypothetical protein
MKYMRFIVIGLLVVSLGYYFAVKHNTPSVTQVSGSEKVVQGQWESKTDTQGPVSITVTPKVLGNNTSSWKFDVVFNTHTVPLDQDPMQVITLTDEKGNVALPVAWEGSPSGGHHREGVLVFKSIQPAPLSVEMKISNVGGISERSFKWDIK